MTLHASIRVHTFREGLLSRLGHDLCLRLDRFELALDGDRIRGRFQLDGLAVHGAVVHGRLDPGAPSAADRAEILHTATGEILHTRSHPEAALEATVERGPGRASIRGRLELAGRSQPLALELHGDGQRLRGAVELVPSRFGIAPYRALGGALRLQDRVRVEVEIQAPGADAGSARWSPLSA